MGKSQETFGKKEVRKKKEKKRKEKEQRRALKKIEGKKRNFNEMIAYVDEFGKISSTPPDPEKKAVADEGSIELTITGNSPDSVSEPLRKGVVTFFNGSKGFGFIRDIKSDEKIFVHINNLIEPVKVNDFVVFELFNRQGGAAAKNVQLLKE